MIRQLVARLANATGVTPNAAAAAVLTADPLDLILHMEQVWNEALPWGAANPPAGPARRNLALNNQFNALLPATPTGTVTWDHLGYSYVLENTRAVQILRRVVRAYRAGESLGIPSVA